MSFDSIKSVEEFYKSYTHKVRFSVCIGSQKLVIDEVMSKKFLCSRQGFKKTNELGMDKRYYIASLVEEHNHILVSPNKTQFLRSNRSITQKAKSTLYTCHKVSIDTSQAYILLQVSDGGFKNTGCMKRNFQNYY
jgi:hypothetical protein